jgi:carbonic anhydrase/truncated hemoglobin YjbI
MIVTDEYLRNNAAYAEAFSGPLPMPPSKGTAVVACMDARLNVYAILGLREGESHVIRNAGGVVTDDAIRSLAISQRLLGTTEIILIHHTDCGMLTFTDDQFKSSIQDETESSPLGPPRRLVTRVRTCGSPGPASSPARSSRTTSQSAASSSTWRPASSTKSSDLMPPAARRHAMLGLMQPTLYEFAGGQQAFETFAAALHARCLADPELNHPFSHPDQHPQHVQRLASYLAETMGGPPLYSRDCGGDQPRVVWLHSGCGDMSDLGRRFANCFMLAADDAGWPDDQAFRAALKSYIKQQVDDVALSHPHDSDIPQDLTIPLWSWDGQRRLPGIRAITRHL